MVEHRQGAGDEGAGEEAGVPAGSGKEEGGVRGEEEEAAEVAYRLLARAVAPAELDPSRASAALDHSIASAALDPSRASVRNNLAAALARLNRLPEALREGEQAAKLIPRARLLTNAV
ncbi:hypothetical protein T484DRAFT_1910269 [Baffinella frigidus]|nr:hypothetical protein T484DRAFT_1910269 [Cryptophyta sp. CCMP2293]